MSNINSVSNANEVREQLLSYLENREVAGLERFERNEFLKVVNEMQFDADTTIPFSLDLENIFNETDGTVHTAKMIISLVYILKYNSIGYTKDDVKDEDIKYILSEIRDNIVGNNTSSKEEIVRNGNVVQYVFNDLNAVIRKFIMELEFYTDGFVNIKTLELYSRNYNLHYSYTVETRILYSLINVFVRKLIIQELKILQDELLKFDDKEKYHEDLQ